MAQEMDDAAVAQLKRVFLSDLPGMMRGESYAEWVTLNKQLSTAYTVNWRGEACEAFQSFLEAQTQQLQAAEKKPRQEQLMHLLVLAEKMDWLTERDVCNALVSYFAAWQRETLSEEEIIALLSLRDYSTGLDEELGKVFYRSLPLLMENAIQRDLSAILPWQKAAKRISLREPFLAAMEVLPEASRKSLQEDSVEPLIALGKALSGLQSPAAQEAIALMSTRLEDIASTEHSRTRLLSEAEHDAVMVALKETNSKELLRKYIDLLAYQPVDAENEENQAALRSEMRAMRAQLFPLMDNSVAHKVNSMGAPWQDELRATILSQLSQMTNSNHSFDSLCSLPNRWKAECKALPFLEYTQVTTYFSGHMGELR